jgi:hypothetical protein
MHGKGKLTLENGSICYSGDFSVDRMCGEGTLTARAKVRQGDGSVKGIEEDGDGDDGVDGGVFAAIAAGVMAAGGGDVISVSNVGDAGVASGVGVGVGVGGVGGAGGSASGHGSSGGVEVLAWASDSTQFFDPTSQPSSSSSDGSSNGSGGIGNGSRANTSSTSRENDRSISSVRGGSGGGGGGGPMDSMKTVYAYTGTWRDNAMNGEGKCSEKYRDIVIKCNIVKSYVILCDLV